jgi:hypothetical protein
MSISSISSQSNNPYRQLQIALNSATNSTENAASGQIPGLNDGDNDDSTSVASLLSAASGQFIDSYA